MDRICGAKMLSGDCCDANMALLGRLNSSLVDWGSKPDRVKLLLISYNGFRFLPILKSVKFKYMTVVRKGVKRRPGCEHSWKHVAAEIRHTVGRNVVENLMRKNVYPGVDVVTEDLLRGGLFQKTLNAALSIETNYAAGPWIFNPTGGHSSHTAAPSMKLDYVLQSARAPIIGIDNEKPLILKKRFDLTKSS